VRRFILSSSQQYQRHLSSPIHRSLGRFMIVTQSNKQVNDRFHLMFVSLNPQVCSLTTVKMEEDFVPIGESDESTHAGLNESCGLIAS
jgi:hypothetical protein